MQAETVLSIRRAGTEEWVDIDPRTTTGQRLLARFYITTEEAMTATTAVPGGGAPRLVVVPGDNAANMGALLRMRAAAARAGDRIATYGRNAWSWIIETFHLDTAWAYAKAGAGWLWDKATVGARFLGTGGMIGLGMTAISSQTGRAIIGTALKPVGWLLGMIGRGYVAMENLLHSDKREGGIRNGVSRGMASFREFLFGNGAQNSDGGILGRGAVWIIAHVAPYFRLDSLGMRLVNAGGMALLVPKAFQLLAMWPLGWATLPAQVILGSLAVLFVYLPLVGYIIDLFAEVIEKGKKEVSADVKAADETVAKTEHVLQRRTEKAAAEATAINKITQPPAGTNRASARAAKRAGSRS